ncbi:MAG: hypothetical protein WCT27_00265 [Patescibacteria group bacterium]
MCKMVLVKFLFVVLAVLYLVVGLTLAAVGLCTFLGWRWARTPLQHCR